MFTAIIDLVSSIVMLGLDVLATLIFIVLGIVVIIFIVLPLTGIYLLIRHFHTARNSDEVIEYRVRR